MIEVGERRGRIGGNRYQAEIVGNAEGLPCPADGVVVSSSIGVGPGVHGKDLGLQCQRHVSRQQLHGLGRQSEQVQVAVGYEASADEGMK